MAWHRPTLLCRWSNIFIFPGSPRQAAACCARKDLLARRDAEIAKREREPGARHQPVLLRQRTGRRIAGSARQISAVRFASMWRPASHWLLLPDTWVGSGPWQIGQLQVLPFDFLPQDDFDRLLWRCDINFVRGEDSFVRAQWAGKPFVWQIYPQAEQAHLVKLDAFLARYTEGMSTAAEDCCGQRLPGMEFRGRSAFRLGRFHGGASGDCRP